MQDLRACAACLVTDVRLHSTSSGDLLKAYRLLCGRQVCQTDDEIPKLLCWECAALVNKFNLFRRKCERAYLLLQDLYRRQKILPEAECKQIDRNTFNLLTTLGFSKPYVISFDSILTADSQVSNEEHDTKAEGIFVELTKSEAENLKLKNDIADVAIKDEINFDSDNDVPLFYLNKDIKSTRKKKKPLKRKSSNKKHHNATKDAANETEDQKINGETDKVDVKNETDLPELKCKLNLNTASKEIVKSKKPLKRKLEKSKATGNKIPKRPKLKHCDKVKEKKIKGDESNKGNVRNLVNKNVDFKEFATAVMLSQEQQMEEVSRRRDTASYREAAFKCALCFKGFVNQNAYANHMRKHDPATGEYQCDVCKSRFKKRYYVADHIYKVHMTKYVCKFCPFVSQCVYQADIHYKWHKGVVYTCTVCREEFTTKSTYLSHRRIKHATEHVCGACGESFVSRLGLLQHRSRLHKGAPAAETGGPLCTACGVRFSCREAWTRHMVISPRHAGERLVRNGCRDCGVCFATEKELRAHRRTQHRRQKVREPISKDAPAEGYPVKCSQCEEVMESARRYWQHFRREHPAEQYPSNNPAICEFCGKGFKCKSVLAYHRNTHTGKRSYACARCPKAFFTPQNLENHLKSHSESRPYVCDVCRKGFKFSAALMRHRRIHTGEKPYVCDVCGKAFADSSGRKVHVRTVHLKEPTPYVSKARLERRRQSEAAKGVQEQSGS